MSTKIPLSQIKALPFDFETAVAAFVKEKQDHRHTVDTPAPTAPHGLVEAAVRRVPGTLTTMDDFVADYQVVDDTPPPPSLDQRKLELAGKITTAAQIASAAVIPLLKQGWWAMERDRIEADMQTATPPQTGEIAADWRTRALAALKKKTPADHAHVTAQVDRENRVTAIWRQAAKVQSDLHDMDEKTIDGWKAPTFT